MDAESLKSAQNLDESEYETDEEALGRDNSKLFPNFHSFILFLIQRIILIYIVLRFFPFPVHVSVSGTLQEDLRNLKLKDFSFIDINSRAPLLVIGNQIFSGEYQVWNLHLISVFALKEEAISPLDNLGNKYFLG